ncbi:MAG: ankyrin repeat domain-containing protein [Planctomycetota bacterium]
MSSRFPQPYRRWFVSVCAVAFVLLLCVAPWRACAADAADAGTPDRTGVTKADDPTIDAFAQAAHQGNLPTLVALLKAHLGLIDQTDAANSEDALFCAMYSQQAAAFTWLLDHGANPNAKAGNGDSILMASILRMQHTPEILAVYAKALVAHGADPSLGEAMHFPLLLAVQKRDIALLRLLLAAYKTPAQGKTACTALLMDAIYRAAEEDPADWNDGELTEMQLLLDHGADPNATGLPQEDHRGTFPSTPLTYLLSLNHGGNRAPLPEWTRDQLIQLLLKNGADPNRADGIGYLPFDLASGWHNWSTVKMLLEHCPDPTGAICPGPTSVLAEACDAYQADIVHLALEKGANPDARGELGETALANFLEWFPSPQTFQIKEASPNDLDPIFRDLLDHGANPNQTNSSGQTMVELAVAREKADWVIGLVKDGADPNGLAVAPYTTLLDWAIDKGRVDLVALLLTRGADSNKTFPGRPSPLDRAVSNLYSMRSSDWDSTYQSGEEICLALIDHGADVNGADPASPPLAVALLARNVKVIDALLAHGANVNLKAPDGVTPFAIAAAHASPAEMKKILQHGGDPMARDGNGETALMAASYDNFGILYRAARKVNTLWLALVWLAAMGVSTLILRRRWRKQPTVLEGVLAAARASAVTAAVAVPGEPATEAVAAVPTGIGESATASPAAPLKPEGSMDPQPPASPARTATRPDPDRISRLEKRIAFNRAEQDRLRQLAMLPLVSWLVVAFAEGVDPVLRSATLVERGVLGGLLFATVSALALLYSKRRLAIVAGFGLSLLVAAAVGMWAIRIGGLVLPFVSAWGLLLLVLFHGLACGWLLLLAWRILHRQKAVQFCLHQLESQKRTQAVVTAPADDFEVPAGWDHHAET